MVRSVLIHNTPLTHSYVIATTILKYYGIPHIKYNRLKLIKHFMLCVRNIILSSSAGTRYNTNIEHRTYYS